MNSNVISETPFALFDLYHEIILFILNSYSAFTAISLGRSTVHVHVHVDYLNVMFLIIHNVHVCLLFFLCDEQSPYESSMDLKYSWSTLEHV